MMELYSTELGPLAHFVRINQDNTFWVDFAVILIVFHNLPNP